MKKYKVGYTTGVFDLFHIGHLNILRRAKEMCETLIVGVSTDDLVFEYKGKRPVSPLDERVAIVGSMRYVDKVVVQESLDKYAAWETLRYNALFHGDDWKGSDMYNKAVTQLESVGVDVVFLPHTPGQSSTLILEKLLEETVDSPAT